MQTHSSHTKHLHIMIYGKLVVLPGAAGLPGCCRGAAGCCRMLPGAPNIVRYIEQGEIQPVLAETFPLTSIAEAQKKFLEKKHVGKFVLVP